MISIFICEDDPVFLNMVKALIQSHVSIENLGMSIVCAESDPEKLLDKLRDNENFGLYFLDMDLQHSMNGIKLAEEIRKHDSWGDIVFITSDADSFRLTFEHMVGALDYIVKDDPNLSERVCKCLKNANAKFTGKNAAPQEKFILKINREPDDYSGGVKPSKNSIISVDTRKIMYFETHVKNCVIVYTENDKWEFRGSLSQIEKQLDKKRFYRCQRNVIVNIENIALVDEKTGLLRFDNGLELDITPPQSRKLRKLMSGGKLWLF